MKLAEFSKTEKIELGGGFPQGDTVLDLSAIDVQKSEYDGKPNYKITSNGDTFFCPKTVMRDLMELQGRGIGKARVTRTGKGKEDTRYTVIGLNNVK